MGGAKGVADKTSGGGGAKGGAKKGKRITIEEVDETNEESKGEEPVVKTTKEGVVETESKPRPPVVPAPLPPAVQKRKDEGNSFFKRGQYGDAVGCYTKCIQLLEKGNLNYMYKYTCAHMLFMYVFMYMYMYFM